MPFTVDELLQFQVRTQQGDLKCQVINSKGMWQEPVMQTCVLTEGKPIKKQEYQQLTEAGRSVKAVTNALPQIDTLTKCGFVDRAFEAITRDDCPDVTHDFDRMSAAAALSALGITLASLYFCVCFRCAAL
jgi:hypothetical protein